MRRPTPPSLRRARGDRRSGGVSSSLSASGQLFRIGAVVLLLYGLIMALLLTTYRGIGGGPTAASSSSGDGGGAGAPLEAGVNSVVRGGGVAAGAGSEVVVDPGIAADVRGASSKLDRPLAAAAAGKKLLGGRLMRRQYEGAADGKGKEEDVVRPHVLADAEDRDSPDDIGLDAGDEVHADNGDENEDDVDDGRAAVVNADVVDNDADQKHFGREDGDVRVDKDAGGDDNAQQALRGERRRGGGGKDRPILTAYVEAIDQSDWKIKPLPARTSTASDLKKVEFPKMNACSKFTGQFPVDEEPSCPVDDDPFLPWIHDAFPTADGKYVQFVAQNKRRCQSGKLMGEIKTRMQPQVALFQHVPVKRVEGDKSGDGETRYRLSTHEEADPDGVEARFICRFHSSRSDDTYETLSVHNFNYDWHTMKKGYKTTFTEEGFDNHMIWTSQLLFRCPVPPQLTDIIKSGETVLDDYATWFVDVVPIRTPPRYGHPSEFMPPRYKVEADKVQGRAGKDVTPRLDAKEMWGSGHVLPRVADSGRWANVPVCKPSLMTYADSFVDDADGAANAPQQKVEVITEPDGTEQEIDKRWDLVACVWTSASFFTRGERRHITDNVDRLREWLEFNFLTGFDHIFVYDNTAAQSELEGESLQPVVDLFPGRVTRVDWPCKVCNNRPGTGDNKGERSSQYAAESSCRLRFGAHTDWIGSFDIDEYMTPMGNFGGMKDVLRHLEKEEDVKVLSFKSKRAWPRLDFLEDPAKTHFKDNTCRGGCFHPKVRDDVTYLQAHNCNKEKPPRKDLMPAEKQIYKADYVLLHFVHYSTVTRISVLNKEQTEKAGYKWTPMYKDRHTKVVDEVEWATMLHGKSIVHDQTEDHENSCKRQRQVCKLGFPFPEGKDQSDVPVEIEEGYLANCFVNERIENYWVPQLEAALQKRGKPEYS